MVVAVVKVDNVRAKFCRAKCSGSRVIAVTKKKYKNKEINSTAMLKTILSLLLRIVISLS